MSGRELKIPGKSSVASSAPTLKPSVIDVLVPCKSTPSKKIVITIKKLTSTEIKLVNLKAVSYLGSEIGNVKH